MSWSNLDWCFKQTFMDKLESLWVLYEVTKVEPFMRAVDQFLYNQQIKTHKEKNIFHAMRLLCCWRRSTWKELLNQKTTEAFLRKIWYPSVRKLGLRSRSSVGEGGNDRKRTLKARINDWNGKDGLFGKWKTMSKPYWKPLRDLPLQKEFRCLSETSQYRKSLKDFAQAKVPQTTDSNYTLQTFPTIF